MIPNRGAPVLELDTHLASEKGEVDQCGEGLRPRGLGIDALAIAIDRMLGDVPASCYATRRKRPLPSGDRSTCLACESFARA